MSVNPYPIDHDAFLAFLQQHDLHATVGHSCDDGDCPLARFLNAQYAGSTFFVGLSEYRRDMDDISLTGVECDEEFSLPEWASQFVWLVDESSDFESGVPVLASEALGFLEAVRQQFALSEVCHD